MFLRHKIDDRHMHMSSRAPPDNHCYPFETLARDTYTYDWSAESPFQCCHFEFDMRNRTIVSYDRPESYIFSHADVPVP